MLTKIREAIAGYKTYLLLFGAMLSKLPAWAEGEITLFQYVQEVWPFAVAMSVYGFFSRVLTK